MRKLKIWIGSCTFIFIFLMLEVVQVALSGYHDSSVYGSQRNQVREQRIHQSWRWRNRNREKKRNNLDLGSVTRSEPGTVNFANDDLTNSMELETIDSCCPTVNEMIQPVAGRNGTGHLVHLYQDERVQQRFYEVSCHPSVVNKPCKFLERRLTKMSQCVQQHSFTYSLVRPSDVSVYEDSAWTLDYISIRSGCTCQVINTKSIKRRGQDKRY